MITVTTIAGSAINLAVTSHNTVNADVVGKSISIENVKLVDGAITGFAKVAGKHTEITANLDAASANTAAAFFADVVAARKAAYRASYDGHHDYVVSQMTK
jgi:hypothetical protein